MTAFNYVIREKKMILLKVKEIKQLMHLLLSENETAFDQFLLAKAEIVTHLTIAVDGHLSSGFYTDSELSELKDAAESEGRIFSEKMMRYHTAKSLCYQAIKGKKPPHSFTFSFYLADENVDKFLAGIDTTFTRGDIAGLSMNLKYEDGELTCTSATALNIFSVDKSLDKAWDNMVKKFFDRLGVQYEELI